MVQYHVEYKPPQAVCGRVRGFAPWNPQAETLTLIKSVLDILAEYRKHLPLTLWQIFYRLVGAYAYDKMERAYKRLCEYLNRARRARMIPFGHIRDDGFHVSGWMGWEDIEGAKDYLRREASAFRLDRQLGQPQRLVLWCEAAGMAPQLERVAEPYSVPVYSSGGFDSLTVKHQIAETFAALENVRVLHIGDHDPSGVHVFGSLDEDVRGFLDEMGGEAEFARLAVTPGHIEEYRLPTAPPKPTDNRAFIGETVQAEALPPDVLAAIVDFAIRESLDMDMYRLVVKREARDRKKLVAWLP